MNLNVNLTGLLELQRQMEILTLPAATRRRLVYRVSKKVMADSKKRVRTQTDLNGRRYADRWRQRTHERRKMLSRLVKEMKVINNDHDHATIGFRGLNAWIAARQQFGYEQTVTPAQNRRANDSNPNSNAPATRRQAAALKREGFKARVGSRLRPVTLSWITANMTIGQAGAILRSMRTRAGQSAQTSWTTRIPARSFLGATQEEIRAHIETVFEQITADINRRAGNRSN